MRKNIIPYTPLSVAKLRAGERREWLLNILAEYGSETPNRVIEETPFDVESIKQSNFIESRGERFGQLARLRWQLASDPFLLLERVTDTVLQGLTIEKWGSYEPYTAPIIVRIEPLKSLRITRGLFPWRVIVSSHQSDFFADYLVPFANWLGIGVDIDDEPEIISHLGRCSSGVDGKEGLVGGIVKFDDTYSLTCQHVISSSCGSLPSCQRNIASPNKIGITNIPDAVLLNLGSPCFEAPESNAETISAATTEWIEYCMVNKLPVFQTHPHSQGMVSGAVKATISASLIDNQIYRFPQIEINPCRISYLYGLIKLPFGKKQFSYPGDSGAWIRDTKTGQWIGMVTAGNNQGVTYASEASCLLDYFSQLTGSRALISATWPKD